MAVMAALYWLQRRRGDAGVVDVGWAAGIGLVAVAAAGSGDGWEPRRVRWEWERRGPSVWLGIWRSIG